MSMLFYFRPKEKEKTVETTPGFVWSVLYYLGWFVGLYFLSAVVFVFCARLEKDEDGRLLVDSQSLHYRACKKCYGYAWKMMHNRVTYIEYRQIGICGYFFRVFWAFIFLPIGYAILGGGETIKVVVYAPFMFLFGYYPWPTIQSMQSMGDDDVFAVEAKRISFPQVGKLELKPYLVMFPALYGWLFWSYPQTTWKWSVTVCIVVLVVAVVVAVVKAVGKIKESENQRVMLAREYIKANWRGICPLLKVKTQS